jgi:hypothetical protein
MVLAYIRTSWHQPDCIIALKKRKDSAPNNKKESGKPE